MKLNKQSKFFCEKCGERLIYILDDAKPHYSDTTGEKRYNVTKICPTMHEFSLWRLFKEYFLAMLSKNVHYCEINAEIWTEEDIKEDLGDSFGQL